MATRKISHSDGTIALEQHAAGVRSATPTVVRYLLQELSLKAPGNSVEVRVPPYGATQCIPGQNHRRGTPPNTIEMNAKTWVALALGKLSWQDAVASGSVLCSGVNADLTRYLPLEVS
ncbi:MAG: sterol carrier family protein [Micrococcaceae bacterium]